MIHNYLLAEHYPFKINIEKMKFKILFVIGILVFYCVRGQAQYYTASFKKDAAPLAVGLGLTALGLVLENNADRAVLEEINLLDRNDLNFLDRGTVDNFSATAQTVSDVILYSAATMPFITYFSNKCRSNGGVIALMALETGLLTGGITNIIKATASRYRPFNYNPMVDESIKLGDSSRKSFISGHASTTASFAFLTARIITDIHPDMKNKYVIWSVAATIPAVIGALRVRAGKHFPTDVIGGYLVGATVGYFIPSMHLVKDNNLNISTNGISGMNVSLKF